MSQLFLEMSADDLRVVLNELPAGRDRRKAPLDGAAISSFIRVMDRAGYQRVSDLVQGAARAWAVESASVESYVTARARPGRQLGMFVDAGLCSGGR